MNAAFRSMAENFERHAWGFDPPYPETVRARYVPTLRERIRWKFRAAREAVARIVLRLLGVAPHELCEHDY